LHLLLFLFLSRCRSSDFRLGGHPPEIPKSAHPIADLSIDDRLKPTHCISPTRPLAARIYSKSIYWWVGLGGEEGHLTTVRFSAMLRRIALLPLPAN